MHFMNMTTQWNGFKRIDFTFKGRNAIIVFPDKPNPKKRLLPFDILTLVNSVYFRQFL